MSTVTPQDWKGKNRFFCKGKFMTGSGQDSITSYVAYGSIVIISAYYISTIGVYYWIDVSPAVTVIGFVLSLLCLFYMLQTSFTDPGAIPRGNVEPPPKENKKDKKNLLRSPEPSQYVAPDLEVAAKDPSKFQKEEKAENGIYNAPAETMSLNQADQTAEKREENVQPIEIANEAVHSHEILVKQQEAADPENKKQKEITLYKHRYCSTCKIMRPPKSSHCSSCDNCVKGFDHHCNFVGTCVGERNIKFFVLFLAYGCFNCFYTFITGIVAFALNIGQNPEIGDELSKQLGFWISGGVLIIFATFFICPKHLVTIKMTLITIGAMLLSIGFIISGHEISLPYYKNPGVILGYIFLVAPYTLWLFATLMSNLTNVLRGHTLKEKAVIDREIKDVKEKNRIFRPDAKTKCINLKDFCLKRKIKSEIPGVW